ncbi:hypothetical protein HOY82DRAFT_568255 [Tuber indicum]|nr:hypothetical protein HOY82DRAFT_568255 [Tuber indicum]
MASTPPKSYLSSVASLGTRTGNMGTHQPNILDQFNPSFAEYYYYYYYYLMRNNMYPWPYEAAMMVMGSPDYGQSAVLSQPRDNFPPALTPSDGLLPNAIQGVAIDPDLDGLDAGAKIATKATPPPVTEGPLGGGNDRQRPQPSPSDPPHTPRPSGEKLKLRKIFKAHGSKRSKPPVECPFDGCGRQYSRSSDCRRHVRVSHMGNEGGTCSRCWIFINRKDNLRKHVDSPTRACLKKMEEIRQGLACF